MDYRFVIDAKRERELARRLGSAIAQRREMVGLTQEQLSELLGIGNQAVSRMERGAVLPSVKRLFEFSDVFGCRTEELVRAGSDRELDQAAVFDSIVASVPARKREAFLAIAERIAAALADKSSDARPKR